MRALACQGQVLPDAAVTRRLRPAHIQMDLPPILPRQRCLAVRPFSSCTSSGAGYGDVTSNSQLTPPSAIPKGLNPYRERVHHSLKARLSWSRSQNSSK